MNGERIIELLYDEFGRERFLTKQISDSTMACLVELMGTTESRHQVRNMYVDRCMNSLEGNEYAISSGKKVRMTLGKNLVSAGITRQQFMQLTGSGRRRAARRIRREVYGMAD